MCCMLICVSMLFRFEGESVKAQVSTTCVPWVLIILIVCPAESGVAIP